MANVKDRIQIRRDTAAAWAQYNPTLMSGEVALETDTLLLKVGDGQTPWSGLRYLNKLNANYFTYNENGDISFTNAFEDLLNSFIRKNEPIEQLTITNAPQLPEEIANKQYVDEVVAAMGTLKHNVVEELPNAEDANENTIYLVKNGDVYLEYMLIDNQLKQIGQGMVDIPVATANTIGGVKSSPDIAVGQDGFMTINRVSTSTLYVPDGDSFVIRSGNATQ